MGTIAEQMQKVIAEWDNQVTPLHGRDSQPKGETEVKEKTVSDLTATAKILQFIEANPSVQKGRIQDYIERNHPEIPSGHIATMLNQFTKRNVVTREEVFNKELNKTVYAYTLIPNDERKQILEAKRERKMTMIERARHAREVKRLKAEKKEKQQGISEALPTTTGQVKTYTDTQEFVNSLPVGKARELYDELKKIFGG
jgi:Cdc6-like AAA superfamily ATPase